MINILRNKKILSLTLGGAGLLVLGLIFSSGGGVDADVPLIPVQKGTLQINVLQGGEIRALSNFEVKSEIEMPTKILSLIPEGYRITEEDVKNGKILIELDSADLRERIINQEIEFQTAISGYIEADEQRAIQASDNQGFARDAEQSMRFALMDFERYMGKEIAQEVLKELKVPHDLESLELYAGNLSKTTPSSVSLNVEAAKTASSEMVDPIAAHEKKAADAPIPSPEGTSTESSPTSPTDTLATEDKVAEASETSPKIDFTGYLDKDRLGDGEAQQKLRQLSNDLLLQRSQFSLSKQNVEASERLAAREFITKTTLENDQLNFEKSKLSVSAGETSLDLFKKYEFRKQSEQALSAYQESIVKLQRTLRLNRSRMAQVESRYQTAKRRYEVQLQRRQNLEQQLEACVIRAKVPGLVAYGAVNGNSAIRNNDVIEEGASVRFRQTLLTIPDMTRMGVGISIHESQVKKIRIGQPCRITVDAEPGKTLEGKVAELAVLPDSGSSRYTPNLKVYPAVVHINGTHDWLKPGMNAKSEIIVDQLDDILYVPVQSIEVENDHYFTYVKSGGSLKRREVEPGSFNDQFIEIKNGIVLGDEVALAIPKRQNLDNNSSATKPKVKNTAQAKPAIDPSKSIAAK